MNMTRYNYCTVIQQPCYMQINIQIRVIIVVIILTKIVIITFITTIIMFTIINFVIVIKQSIINIIFISIIRNNYIHYYTISI